MCNFVQIAAAGYLGVGFIFGFIRFVSAITWISFGPDTGLGFLGGGIYGGFLMLQAIFTTFLWPLTLYAIYNGNYNFFEAIFFPWFSDVIKFY